MKKMVLVVSYVSCGICIGFLIALSSVRLEVLLDYDSGQQKNRIRIGPITIREDTVAMGQFQRLLLSNGRNSLTGTPDWHTAFVFGGNSRISPTFEAGDLVNAIRRLEIMFERAERAQASEAKERFLTAVAQRKIVSAIEISRTFELKEQNR